VTFKMQTKNDFFTEFFLKIHLHQFSKIKVKKSHKTVGNQGFSYYFCLMILTSD
jgi:hypothetical protein